MRKPVFLAVSWFLFLVALAVCLLTFPMRVWKGQPMEVPRGVAPSRPLLPTPEPDGPVYPVRPVPSQPPRAGRVSP